MSKHLGRIAATALFCLAQTALASAADIKVFSTIGVQAALEELAPKFEKATGNKLAITWGTAAMLVKRVQGGESADLYVLTKQGFDALAKEGKASASPDALFASSGMAMVVKKGAAKPDISTPEKYKATLLNAKSIAYSNPAAGGVSGVFFAKTLDRMGIAEQMKEKSKHPPAGGKTANLVVSGEAELAVQQEPEVISVAGVDIVGAPPGDLNNVVMYFAGPAAGSAHKDAGDALVRFLHTPEAQAVFKKRGLKPA
jgi:molybdate transport system substrate-binding protein